MRCPSAILVIALVAGASAMAVEEPQPAAGADGGAAATAPPAAADPAAQREAERFVLLGKQAMQESNDKPSRSVDAAVAFSKAIKFYEKSGDIDTVCDLEANIFWCKKRMDVGDVKSFVAQKGGDQDTKDALARVDAVAAKTVPKEEAQNYFTRAEKFSKEHPEDLDGIIAHYIEVAERFTGSDLAIKAQKLSLEAQSKQRAQYKSQQEAQRETLFTKSTAAAASAGHQSPVPDAATLRTTVASVRKLYKDAYAKTKPAQKRHLAIKLLNEAPATKDDPVTAYALLSEAIDLSIAASDWYTTFTACDAMAQTYAGVDAKAKKKEVFAKVRSNPTVQAIVKLLDNPEDADANAVVGRYFCYEGGNWTIGLPLLAHGSDADLKTVAEMEMLKPSGAAEQVELGDKWYALGKKAKQPAQVALLARAAFWYSQAEPLLTGITKERVGQRCDEIYQQVPETGIDYAHITAKQWERLHSKPIEINAANAANDIGIGLGKGDKVCIVPDPAGLWTMHYENWHWSGGLPNVFDTNAAGVLKGGGGTRNLSQYPGTIGMMMVTIGAAPPVRVGEHEGEGKVLVGPALPGGGMGQGKIRIKVVVLDEE